MSQYKQVCPVVFGFGASKEAGTRMKAFGAKNILLISDEFIVKQPFYSEIKKSLTDAGLKAFEYGKCLADPPEATCDEAAVFAQRNAVDGIVAVGGGSVIDTAKAVSMVIATGKKVADLYNVNETSDVPLIAIPTNSGTGSEATSFSVVTSAEGRKCVIFLAPNLAIVDPELTFSAPSNVTCSSGLDAFSHAAEAITSSVTVPGMWGPNPRSDVLGQDAIRRIVKYLPAAVADGSNREAREQISLASNFAGIAFEDTMCQLGHSIAHSAGSAFHITHGLCCGLAMPVVLKFTATRQPEKTKMVADAMGIETDGVQSGEELAAIISEGMIAFLREVNAKSYKEMGYTREQIVGLADMVMTDACWPFVEQPLEKPEVEQILGDMYDCYQ
ncbi:iron-containing alcohol dehydrogenase [Curtanaerobium respiraculi]|uniref:iron-containing alcohol dehydrogenase n=1 Tax=Curtanaerobium respiraculi TaxID=2949669 RepID=UPI0024B3816A|nr:iron-containing alcohol dehydrogenase [Curtanaerobium respiraculi]